jgi:hypothetical protein
METSTFTFFTFVLALITALLLLALILSISIFTFLGFVEIRKNKIMSSGYIATLSDDDRIIVEGCLKESVDIPLTYGAFNRAKKERKSFMERKNSISKKDNYDMQIAALEKSARP